MINNIDILIFPAAHFNSFGVKIYNLTFAGVSRQHNSCESESMQYVPAL